MLVQHVHILAVKLPSLRITNCRAGVFQRLNDILGAVVEARIEHGEYRENKSTTVSTRILFSVEADHAQSPSPRRIGMLGGNDFRVSIVVHFYQFLSPPNQDRETAI